MDSAEDYCFCSTVWKAETHAERNILSSAQLLGPPGSFHLDDRKSHKVTLSRDSKSRHISRAPDPILRPMMTADSPKTSFEKWDATRKAPMVVHSYEEPGKKSQWGSYSGDSSWHAGHALFKWVFTPRSPRPTASKRDLCGKSNNS